MIYRGQFSDYNSKVYTLDFETPNTDSGSDNYTWNSVINDTFADGTLGDWVFHQDTEENPDTYVKKDNEPGLYRWLSPYVPRTIQDGNWSIVSLLDTRAFNGIDVGDEIEFKFKVKCTLQYYNNNLKANSVYGIKFGLCTPNVDDGLNFFYTITDTYTDIDDFNTDGAEYSYKVRLTNSENYFGFVFDAPNINWFAFRDLVIYNHTKGTTFDILNGTDGWHIADYNTLTSDDVDLTAEAYKKLYINFPDTYTGQDGVTYTAGGGLYAKGSQTNGQFGDGIYYEVWVYCASDNMFDITSLSNGTVNTSYRYPNFWFKKPVELKKGTYKFSCEWTQWRGKGLSLQFRKGDDIVYQYDFDTVYDGWTSNLESDEFELDSDVDTLFFGNDTGDLYSGSNIMRNFVVYNKQAIVTPTNLTEITLGGTPFTIELEGDEDNLFKPIRSSLGTANIVSDQYLFDLYSNTNDIDVSLYDESNNIKWMGIVKPLVFNMGYDEMKEEIEIECVDYLTILDEIYLSDVDIVKDRPLMTFGEMFAKILSENTKYNTIYYPEIFGFDMFDEYSVTTSNFISDDCYISDGKVVLAEKNWSLYKILEEMCKYMGVTLSVEGDSLILIPYLHLQYAMTFKKFKIGDELTLKSSGIDLHDSEIVTNLYDSSDLSLLPVLNKFSVKTKTNKIDEILPDFLDDDNVQNITDPIIGTTDYYTYTDLGTIITDGDDDDKMKKYKCSVKMLKCKSDKCTNYMYSQSKTPTSMGDFNNDNISVEEGYPVRFKSAYGGIVDIYSGGIVDFKAKDVTEEREVPAVDNGDFTSNTQASWDRYLVLCKGKAINCNMLAGTKPLFKIVSDEMQFTNKMALQISGSLFNVPYLRGEKLSESMSNFYSSVPLDREDTHWDFKSLSNGETRGYRYGDMFTQLGVQIKIGDYYFNNIGAYYTDNKLESTCHFFRNGWWTKSATASGGVTASRLQFECDGDDYGFNTSVSITDNSGDDNIDQDSSGYWIMFNANESQGTAPDDYAWMGQPDTFHATLPDHFTGRLEITFFPSSLQSINKDNRYIGDYMQFLKDFKVKLVIPRDMSMSEDEWNSETEITAIVDATSFQDAEDITCELHSDFGKCPAHSIVIGAKSYSINTISEEGSHMAEEWIVYNYTKQYGAIRKVLNTSLKEDIKPYSIITMKDRSHFSKMMVDSYKKDIRTGLSEVKLVEISDL